MYGIVVIITGVLLTILVQGIEGGSSCIHPQGWEGKIFTEGCLKKECKGGVWRVSLDTTVCCYDGKDYSPNTIVSTTMSKDHCVRATMECKEDRGEGRLELSVKNLCADYATWEQVADLENLVENFFVTNCVTEPIEAKSDRPLRDLLLVDITSRMEPTQVLQIPTLTQMPNCSVPKFPHDVTLVDDQVTGILDGNLVICGGIEYGGTLEKNPVRKECNALKEGEWTEMPSMTVPRWGAAASMTSKGWLVTGGYTLDSTDLPDYILDSTEFFDGEEWLPGPNLPEPRTWHCQVTVGSHVFIFGGQTNMDGIATNTCYMLNGEEWISLPDMKEAWNDPFCAALDNSIFVIKDDKIKIFDISSLTWSTDTGLWMWLGGMAALYNSSTYVGEIGEIADLSPTPSSAYLVSASEIGC